MAIRRISSYDDYIGLSSDTKPTKGISTGTCFTELDTGARFIFDGDAWEEDLILIYALSQVMGVE